MTPAVTTLFVPFLILLLAPLLGPWSDGTTGRKLGMILIIGGISGGVWLAATDGFSERYPRPGDLFHYTDTNVEKAYWATSSSADQLPGGPDKIVRFIRPTPSKRLEIRITEAPAVPIVKPQFALTRSGDQAKLSISTQAIQRDFYLFVRPATPLSKANINGKPVNLPAKKWTRINHRAEIPVAFALEWTAEKAGDIELLYLSSSGKMPAGGPKPNGPPTNQTRFSGAQVVKGTTKLSWPDAEADDAGGEGNN